MLFNSFSYLVLFLPTVVLLSLWLRDRFGAASAQLCVVAASLIFYAWGRPTNLIYLGVSILGNWLVASALSRSLPKTRGRWLRLGILLNIAYLCTFKYLNFFLGSLPYLRSHHLLPDLEFPLGISFFTLSQIMYLVDCSDELVPAMNLLDHLTFVSFFPYIISGPIAKSKRMLHQFGNFGLPAETRFELLARGLHLIAIGLFKKVVFAFCFGYVADFGFNATSHLSAEEAWFYSIAYTMQIYFDFSGYTDMAVGSAMMLGIEIPRNFDAPLRSKSIIEFWQRWHISLSNFITSYLYTPIVRSLSPVTMEKAAFATLVAMAIAGLWHGPRWTFVLFGLIHGGGLVANQYWRKMKMPRLNWLISWALTFVLVDIAFIFFRSPTVLQASSMTRSLFNIHNMLGTENLNAMRARFSLTTFGPPILIGLFVAFAGKTSDQLARDMKPGLRNAAAIAIVALVALVYMNSHITQQFVYFKF